MIHCQVTLHPAPFLFHSLLARPDSALLFFFIQHAVTMALTTASRIRLRPIIWTSFYLGAVPMIRYVPPMSTPRVSCIRVGSVLSLRLFCEESQISVSTPPVPCPSHPNLGTTTRLCFLAGFLMCTSWCKTAARRRMIMRF